MNQAVEALDSLNQMETSRNIAIQLLTRLCNHYHNDNLTSGDFAHELKLIVDEADDYLDDLNKNPPFGTIKP